MKPVSILIPNKNSYEAIQLCVESIRKYTRYPDYKVIVYDDGSTNGIDLTYLKNAKDRGLVQELIIGTDSGNPNPAIGHGNVLNVLINKVCQTPLAMVMDSDAYIRGYGWLTDLIETIDIEKDLVICNTSPKGMFAVQGYRLPSSDLSFGLLNMEAYKDNMQVDWKPKIEDRRQEPFLSLFADIYPPEKSEFFRRKGDKERFQENQVIVDVGSNIWMKANYDNPKGYRMISVPENIREKYRHIGHASIVGITAYSLEKSRFADQARHKFVGIKNDLEKLRSQ